MNLSVSARADLPPVHVIDGRLATDEAAIEAFLTLYIRKSPNTYRAYRRECMRFLVWLRATHRTDSPLLHAVRPDDIVRYLDFLEAPQTLDSAFLARYGFSQQPFRQVVSKKSVKLVLAVLSGLFKALQNTPDHQGKPYCLFNPVALVPKSSGADADDSISIRNKSFSHEEMNAVFAAIDSLPRDTEQALMHYFRVRWVVNLLYRAWLRREEAASHSMGAFAIGRGGRWKLIIKGKGGRLRTVMVSARLLEELRLYRQAEGFSALPAVGDPIPLVASARDRRALGGSGIYRVVKEIFYRASNECNDANIAHRLRLATPHWLRHTGITHAMEAGVDPRYVQAQAGHASLNTTAIYDHAFESVWAEQMDRIA